MVKKFILFSLSLLGILTIAAKPQFQHGKRYQIVCEQYSNGCASIGSANNKLTPVYYLVNGGSTTDCYWYITEEESNQYSIRNASTGEYVSLIAAEKNNATYVTNSGSGNDIRYVHLTQGLDEDYPDKSLWTITVYSGNYFSIRNVFASNHLWDLRVSPSFVLGTYDRLDAPNQNQRFMFYDENDHPVEDVEETTSSSYDVSSWLVANTDESSGNWHNNGWSYMSTHGEYYNSESEASIVIPFYEKWNDSMWGALPDCSLSQTLQNLPAGSYTLQADLIAVRQPSGSAGIEEQMGTGVTLFVNNEEVDVSTWNGVPVRYTIDFTVGDLGTVTLGVRAENTNANWLAIDNIFLYYNVTDAGLIAGELTKLRADAEGKMTAATLENRIAQTDGSFEQLEALRQEILTMPDLSLGYDVSSWLVASTEKESPEWHHNIWWHMKSHGSYVNGEASVSIPFYETWVSTNAGTLANDVLYQTMTNLPAGSYTLQADMIAVNQRANTPASGVTLYAGNSSVRVSTYNESPVRYKLDFTVPTAGSVELGVRLQNTNANWVAIDNIALYYQTTETELLTGELAKLRADASLYLTSDEIEEKLIFTDETYEALEELRHNIISMPLLGPLSQCAKDITIKGRSLFYVESLDVYLCSISEKHFGTNFTDTIAYSSINGYGPMYIDGLRVDSGEVHTFPNVEAQKTYNISFKKSGSTVTYSVMFTSLPIVRINGDFDNSYSPGYITVAQPNKKKAELLNMKAKWRGGITNGDDKHKRNYHVKFLDEMGYKLNKRFFDLRKDNSWILESCQVDMGRIRNRVLTDLWNDYRRDPYYIDQASEEVFTGTRGEFVELILNNDYRGIYCMTEAMDRKQMNLKKYDEQSPDVHGQLWKSKDWSYSVFMGHNTNSNYYPGTSPAGYDNTNEMWDSYSVKYPDIEEVYPTDWSTLYNAVNFVCTASDEDFKAHIAEYFDMPVVIDYYILMETILSTDNHGKNMYFAVYDKQVDKKITFAVWDMDATCGQRWSDAYYHQSFLGPEQDYAQFITDYEHGDYNLFRRLRDTDADNFNQRVAKRYRDLRANNLATDSILRRFQNYFTHFRIAGADQREYARWNGDSDIAGHTLDFNEEYNYLADWFTRRMNYLDNTRFDIASLPQNGDVNCDGLLNDADVTAIVDHILGKKQTRSFNEIFADVNGDGRITIADVTCLVNTMSSVH